MISLLWGAVARGGGWAGRCDGGPSCRSRMISAGRSTLTLSAALFSSDDAQILLDSFFRFSGRHPDVPLHAAALSIGCMAGTERCKVYDLRRKRCLLCRSPRSARRSGLSSITSSIRVLLRLFDLWMPLGFANPSWPLSTSNYESWRQA